MLDIKAGWKKVQNTVLNRSEIEIKVREATSNDPWGASGSLKLEIAEASFNYENYKTVMATIWTRLQDSGKNYRHVLKGMQLIEYLVGHGSERVIEEAKEQIFVIKTLRNFQYVDEKGKDLGHQVREQAKKLVKLLGDDKAISEERKAAKKSKNKYEGVSSDTAQRGRGRYDDTEERPSKYDNKSDDEHEYKPKKKTTYDSDEEKKQPEEEPEQQAETKPKPSPATKKVRPPSNDKIAPVKTAPPPQQKEKDLLDFLGGGNDPFAPAPAPAQQPVQQPMQPDPFGTFQGGNGGFGNDNFGEFTAEFKEENFEEKEKLDQELGKNLANFSLKDPQPQQTNSGKAKSLNEKRMEKGGSTASRTPSRVPSTIPTSVPAFPPGATTPGGYPPGAYPPGAYPPTAYPPTAYPPTAYPPGYGVPPAYPPGYAAPPAFPAAARAPGAYPPANPFGARPN